MAWLFPVHEDKQKTSLNQLDRQIPTSPELNRWMHGFLYATPLESYKATYPTRVPDVRKEEYTRIEEAKRRKAKREAEEKAVQIVRIKGMEVIAPWTPPHEHPSFVGALPDLRKFERNSPALKMRFPRLK